MHRKKNPDPFVRNFMQITFVINFFSCILNVFHIEQSLLVAKWFYCLLDLMVHYNRLSDFISIIPILRQSLLHHRCAHLFSCFFFLIIFKCDSTTASNPITSVHNILFPHQSSNDEILYAISREDVF